MHPTPDEQLRAVLRSIDEVAAEPSLSPSSRAALDDARRLVRRLERTWTRRLPFLLLDNHLAAELLSSLAPMLPQLVDEIESAATAVSSIGGHTVEETTVHGTNKRLQDLLARAVHLLPDGHEGNAARSRIAAHARSRLAADPTLNRTPTDRLPPQEPNP